jgi:WD40 repeat protein
MIKITPSSHLANHPITITTNDLFPLTLPKEIFLLIFSRLKDSDVIHLARASRHFYSILTYIPLWESRLRDHFPDSYANLKFPDESLSLYKRLRIADRNIKDEDYIEDKHFYTLCEHENIVKSLSRSGNLLISGSKDGIIKIYDIKKRQLLHTLKAHEGEITNILTCGDRIISGSFEDRTIKVWNINGECLKEFKRYQGQLNSLAVYGDYLICGQSKYGALRIWNLTNGQQNALIGSQSDIQCITVDGDLLFSGSSNGKIAVWDLKAGKELKTFSTGHLPDYLSSRDVLRGILLYNSKLISFSQTHTEILDLENGGQLRSLEIFNLNLVACDGKLFYQKLRSLEIWDIETESRIFMYPDGDFESSPDFVGINSLCCLFSNGQLIFSLGKKVVSLDFTHSSLPPNHPSFLIDLGIVTEKSCLEKLGCTPDFLSEIGICSSTDLQALRSISPAFNYLEIESEETASNNINQYEVSANNKKNVISSFLQTLLNTVQKKSNEAELYGRGRIWIGFQSKLTDILTNLNQECQIRQVCLKKFSPQFYKNIVAEMNGLIDEFRELDRKHQIDNEQIDNQIAALSAYIGQPDLLELWKRLRSQGINSLSTLLEQKKIDDFNPFSLMGHGILQT